MPSMWLYFVALFLPLVARVLLLNTGFVEWLWYNHYEDHYMALATLRINEQFLKFVGGWPLPVFILTVSTYWMVDEEKDIGMQFMLLPIAYVPFTILGDTLLNLRFDPSTLYTHPLVVIPWGYLYVVPWSVAVWALGKLRIVV